VILRDFREPIAIHAGKTYVGPWACELPVRFTDAAVKALWPGCTDCCAITANWDKLPRGEIIATAELVGCHRILDDGSGKKLSVYLQRPHYVKEYIQGNELLFGDFSPGRFAWEFANVKMLTEPIPAKGAQGLWNWRTE